MSSTGGTGSPASKMPDGGGAGDGGWETGPEAPAEDMAPDDPTVETPTSDSGVRSGTSGTPVATTPTYSERASLTVSGGVEDGDVGAGAEDRPASRGSLGGSSARTRPSSGGPGREKTRKELRRDRHMERLSEIRSEAAVGMQGRIVEVRACWCVCIQTMDCIACV